MKIFCDYHPTRPAQWECPPCNATYCSDCVSNRVIEQYGSKKTLHFCPKCDAEAERLSISNTVTPFWIRLPSFFVYPFHPRPLFLMAMFSIATVLFSDASPFAALVRVAAWGVLFVYSFAVLRCAATGSLIPPKMSAQTFSRDLQVVFKQLAIYIIIAIVLLKVAQAAGILVGLVFLALTLLSIPSMIIVLVCTNSLFHAINPLIFVRMAWRIGRGYLLMYFFLVLLGSAPAILGRFTIAFLPNGLHLFLLHMAESFYTIISYYLMGYVIFQYQDELGYQMELDDEALYPEQDESKAGPRSEILNKVDILIKEGKIDDAVSVLKDNPGEVASDIGLAERYYKLLKIKQLKEHMLHHAKTYLDLLAKADEKEKLCATYMECIAEDATFTPRSTTLLRIAGALNEVGDPRGAVEAYRRFIKTDPKNTLIPKVYFLAANIINEKLNNPSKAAGILSGLMKTYPNHEITPYVQRYLAQMKVS